MVGSAGGNLTMAACCLEIWGAGADGVTTLWVGTGGVASLWTGGSGCDVCGGGVTGAAAAATSGSLVFGASSTLGAALVALGPPSK